jgi:hypothetical protein
MKFPDFFAPGRVRIFAGRVAIGLAVIFAVTIAPGVRAQDAAKPTAPSSSSPESSPKTLPPRPAAACCGYDFPRAMDAEIADSDVHRILYQDDHVMFMEVINPPALDVHMHGHPYASVFAHDSTTGAKSSVAQPSYAVGPTRLDPASPYNNMGSSEAPAPAGAKWPTCTDSAPQAPHRPYNGNVAPNHFYRLEFLRLDGDDISTHWRDWYPEMTQPEKPVKPVAPKASGPNFSEQWAYPIAYDSIQAAPNNYKLLFEDAKMRLLEVTVRPGETTPMHGSPYSSVLAFNTIENPADITDTKLDPDSPLNGQGAGHAGPPTRYDLKVPTCMTTAPRAPHAIHNGGTVPLHYYQIEYKRIDGDGLTENWRKWYPWMQYMQFMR